MKRLLAAILTLIMLLNLAACATNDNTPPTASDSTESTLPAVSDNAEKNFRLWVTKWRASKWMKPGSTGFA